MAFALALLTVLSLSVSCYATCTSPCLVSLPLGLVQGKCNNGMCSYTNIPYALAPIGTRRFEAPVPFNETWYGIRDATKPPVACVQFSEYHKESLESEDCLFVHIHTPATGVSSTYPVRAYIHGGGFMFGSSGDTDPSRIVKRNMIVVSIGYRLGALGFLSTGNSCIPGNNGLKDQREALRWIKKYIAYFEGDPSRVLLTGFSAGGASTHLHVLRSEKLFSAAMANNGDCFDPWVMQAKPYMRYAKFVDILGCSPLCSKVKNCIKSKSVRDIVSATNSIKVYRDNPFNVFGVVIESPTLADAFITETPEDIIRSGNYSNVPFLMAYTEREGSYNAADWLNMGANGKALITQLNDPATWLKYAPHMLFFNNTLPEALLKQRSTELRNLYMGNNTFTESNYRAFEDMFTDVLYLNGIRKSLCLHRKYGHGKVYAYEYKYPHTYGVGNLMAHRTDITFGADHGADGIFTLPLLAAAPSSLTANEQKISARLCDLYKSLADGRATYDGIELPLNTALTTGKLTINEFCHDFEYCNEYTCGDCSKYE